MKKFILIIALIFSLNTIFAQITINSTDIGKAGSNTVYSLGGLPAAYTAATGADYIWDFRPITAVSQSMPSYINYSDANPFYTFVFKNKANLASPRKDTTLMGIKITESYDFINKSTTSFSIVGNGGKVNGIPIPIVYDSPDVIYKFPLNYGDLYSSDSHFDKTIPLVAFLEQDLHRVNEIDGWGTLKTPFGTYQCLRLKSTIVQIDSVFIVSKQLGMKIPIVYTKYTWLAKSMDFPVAVAVVLYNKPDVAYITYMDSYNPNTGINDSQESKVKMTLLPNPATNNVLITLKATNNVSDLIVTDITGREIIKKSFTNNTNIDISDLAKGVYIINILNNNKRYSEKLIVK